MTEKIKYRMHMIEMMQSLAPILISMTFALGVLLAACVQPEDEDDREGWHMSVNFHDTPTNEEKADLFTMVERHGGDLVSLDRGPPIFWVYGLPTEAICQDVRMFAQSLDSVGNVSDCKWRDNE